MAEQDKKTGILSALLGIQPLKRAYSSIGWFGQAAGRIKEDSDILFKPDKKDVEIPLAIKGAQARFEWLRQERELSDEEILAMRRNTKSRFTLWAIASVFMFAYAFISPMVGLLGHSMLPILDRCVPWILAFVVFLQAVRWSYWHLQLRMKALVPLTYWLSHPKEWLAPLDDRVTKILGLMALAVVFHPVLAYAQTTTTPTTSSMFQTMFGPWTNTNDLSYQWMVRLFPSVFTASGVSYAQDAVAQIFGTINTLFCALGGGMLAYHTITGLVSVAHEGKVLGQRFHLMWAPIRVCMGVAAVVPINGYCVAQLLAIQIILAGYGLANIAWTTYVSAVTGYLTVVDPSGQSQTITKAPAIVIPAGVGEQQGTLEAILADETCFWASAYADRADSTQDVTDASTAVNKLNSDSSSSGSRPNYIYPPTQKANANGDQVWDYGRMCGSVTWPIHQASTASSVITTTAKLLNIPSYNNTAADGYEATFDNARATAFGQMVSTIEGQNIGKQIAALVVPGGQQATISTNISTIQGLISQAEQSVYTFKSAILTAAGTLSQSLNSGVLSTFQTNATSLGWASAGVLQPQIVQISSITVNRVVEKATILAGGNYVDRSSNIAVYVSKAEAYLGAQIGASQVGASQSATGSALSTQLVEDAGRHPVDTLAYMSQSFFGSITTWLAQKATLDIVNPIGSIQDLGTMIMLFVETTWIPVFVGLMAGARGASGAIQTASSSWLGGLVNSVFPAGPIGRGLADAAIGALTALMSLWNGMSWWMFAVGAGMSVILPLLQYTMWLFAIAGLVTFSIEAVVASSFWAFAHIRMDGQDLIDSPQRHGYAILFNALFRPTLMLLGLIFSNIAFGVLAAFVNETFSIAATLSNGGSITGLFTIMIQLSMLLYIHYHLATRCYSLITLLPDRVARWMGAGGENLGEEQAQSEARSVIVGGVSAATGRGGGLFSKGLQGAMGKGGGGGGRGPSGGNPEVGGAVSEGQNALSNPRGERLENSDK
jgi:conjugal transfer/type IV secretion protein DotA/TraY